MEADKIKVKFSGADRFNLPSILNLPDDATFHMVVREIKGIIEFKQKELEKFDIDKNGFMPEKSLSNPEFLKEKFFEFSELQIAVLKGSAEKFNNLKKVDQRSLDTYLKLTELKI